MPIFYLFLKGIGIGFAVAAPVGPIGLLCIRFTLEKGRLAGFCAGLGAAIADTIFAAIGIFGVTAVKTLIESERFWLELGGGIFLVLFGLNLMRKKPVMKDPGGAVPQTLFADFLKTLILTLANPSTILSFMAIFLAMPGLGDLEFSATFWPILGVFIGSAGWWLTLAGGIGMIRHAISEAGLIRLNLAAGGFLTIFGLYTLWRLLAA